MNEFEIREGILIKYCGSNSTVIIPASVTSISEEVFFDCANIKTVVLPQGITSIGARAFKHCVGIETLILPESLTCIGDEAFAYCFNLQSIDLPDSIMHIADNAFLWCERLDSINCYETTNPKKHYKSRDRILYTQDEKTLVCCPGRAVSGTFAVSNGVINIGRNAFTGCSSIKKLILPESIINIGDEAVACCECLRNIDLPDSVLHIGKNAFSRCEDLDAINCYKTSNPEKHYKSKDGILYTKDGKILVCYPMGKVNSSYAVPKGVKCIGAFAFVGNWWIKYISLPEGLLNIGEGAFSECPELQEISIPKSVKNIETPAFLENPYLEIQVVTGSYAETYAKENNINFEVRE
jgi:hypothetical protein